MRIALVTTTFLPLIGGAEFVVHHLARAWARQGHTVRVFNWETAEATHAEGLYDVARYRLLRGTFRAGHTTYPWGAYAAREIRRGLDAFAPDFISAHWGFPVGAWLGTLRPHRRFVVTCHGSDITLEPWGLRTRRGVDRALAGGLRAAAGVIALTGHARKLVTQLGVDPERIVDIPNGVDLTAFARVAPAKFRSIVGLRDGTLVVLSVGREHTAKGYEAGIRAFARVAARRPDARYVILGHGTEVWRPLCRSLGIEDRIVLHPGLQGDALLAAYQQADVFFSPSRSEVFPLVVLEAMAGGRALVVTNVSGSQDVVESGRNGVVIEPGDVDAMANALDELLGDSVTRARMGNENRVRVRRYDWDAISREYLELAKVPA